MELREAKGLTGDPNQKGWQPLRSVVAFCVVILITGRLSYVTWFVLPSLNGSLDSPWIETSASQTRSAPLTG